MMSRKLVVAVALFAVSTFAQTKQETDAFRLTMPKVRASITALKNVIEAAAADPALAQRLKAEKDKLDDTNGRDTMSMVAARLESREPKIAAAYRSAGITPKEAGMTMETLVGVMFGSAMLESTKTNAKLPEGFVAENMDFYRQHKNEVMGAFAELKNLSEKAKAFAKKSDEEEDEPGEQKEKN